MSSSVAPLTRPRHLHVEAPICAAADEILSPEALGFLEKLVLEFTPRRDELLRKRAERQWEFDAGCRPDFLAATEGIRKRSWRVAPVPTDLQDRRVEITGPVDRKMVINALNSGASTYMADFEDSCAPMWSNLVQGQLNLRDAVDGTIEYLAADGRRYAPRDETATLLVRPRGLHLPEKHVLIEERPVPGALFDFAIYFFHNAAKLLEKGSGPYFYIPKLESHLEARLWNDIFQMAQDELGMPRGSIRATVLIETLPAAFEMDEILYELRDHSAGLNCGRWDYIFSIIKKFRQRPEYVMPDRAQVTMTTHCMRSYSLLAIRTCHRRGAHAIGGMAAQIPIRDNPAANEEAMAKVRADKEREARDGHDGTWVAHPGLVATAKEIFDDHMPGANQIERSRDDVRVTAEDLLTVPTGEITEAGLTQNVDVGIRYLAAWLSGNGCVPLYNLMEDAATAEISRSQLWQWVWHGAKLADGRTITAELCRERFGTQIERLKNDLTPEAFAKGNYELAARLMQRIVLRDNFHDFLTLVGYDHID